VADAREALKFLANQEEIERDNVGLAGYSFGAGVAMKAALQDDLPRAMSIVARARIDPEDDFGRRPSLPVLFVVGDQDQLMPPGQFDELSARLTTPPEMHIVRGADHFFQGHEREAGGLVAAFFQRWLKPTAQK
jgi:alpha/beta superfamily hydrolase